MWASRYFEGGDGGHGGPGAGGQGHGQGKGCMYQGGVGTGMGGLRICGPNRCDQTYIPECDPSHRERAPGRAGVKGKAGGGRDRGEEVRLRLEEGSVVLVPKPGLKGVMGMAVGCKRRVGERRMSPLPVGEVLSDRERAPKARDVLRGILEEAVGTSMERLVLEHLPPAAEPVPPPSPTEYQRVVRLGHLLDQRAKLEKGLGEGRVRVEKAKARALEEEGKVTSMEKELSEVLKQVDAHKAEDKRRERSRREEAREARGREWRRSTLTWT